MTKPYEDNLVLSNPVFEAIASSSEDVYIYVLDQSTGLSHWSKSCVDYFALPGEYMLNVEEIWVKYIHPDDRSIFLEDIRSIISGRSDTHSCQYRALNRYGNYVWLECRGKVFTSADGQTSVFGGIMKRIDNYTKYDPLTKLLSDAELISSSFSDREGTLLLVSLDHFRTLVSSYGKQFSDRVLVSVANTLRQMCSSNDRLYRFSHHEFLFDLPGRDSNYAGELFDWIINVIGQVRRIGDHSLKLSASGGIVVYPRHSQRREELISYLEHSIQHAKDHCRGKAVLYTRTLFTQHMELLNLRAALTESIENSFRGFELYYQPVIFLRNNNSISCECLLRWHNNGEIIKPERFIPVLEESGEILAVGRWVMEEAFRTLKDWESKDLIHHIGFNTSPVQYIDSDFTHCMIETGRQIGIVPNHVTVELTESCGIEDSDALCRSVNMMRQEGYRVSMDDFGMEYSTMSLLRDLRVDSIKIDHTFVLGLRRKDSEVEHAIVQAMIDMSHRIGIKVVGEGIEDEELSRKMTNMGVDFLQGYLFSEPVSKKEFEHLVPTLKKRFQIG